MLSIIHVIAARGFWIKNRFRIADIDSLKRPRQIVTGRMYGYILRNRLESALGFAHSFATICYMHVVLLLMTTTCCSMLVVSVEFLLFDLSTTRVLHAL